MKEKYPTAPPAKTVEESAPSTDASTDPSSGSHSHSLFSNSSTNSTASFREAALKTRQLMPRVDRVFPVLIQFEITLDWKISAIGLLLEFIQLIGLVLNGNFTWGPVFGNEVAKVIYFFDFPLFDSDWASNTFGAANAFFWIFLLMLLSWILVVIHFMFQDFQRMPRWMQAYCQFVAHAVASFAVIPMGMMFMSFIVCDAGFHEMFWFNETCFGGYSIAYFIFSVIGMLALALVLYIGTSFLHDDMPDSTNLLARPNPYLCDLHAAMKLAAVICFHVLLSKGQAQAFCITLCAMAATLAVLYVYFLPYYNLRVNRFRVGEMAAVAVVAAVAIPCASSDSTWNSKSISTVVAIAGGALAFIGGWFVAGVRVNADYLKAIDTLRHHSSNAAVCIGEEDYPRRLPVDDLIFTRYPTIEKLIMGDRVREQKRKSKNPLTVRFNLSAPDGDGDEGGSHARGGRGSARHNSQDEEDEEEGRQQPHTNGSDDGSEDHELYLDRMSVLIPYITNIYASTDIELATRFLRDFREQSGSVDPTPRMCAFAGRIMTKGLVKYSSDPLLVYQFCIFLAIFGKKLRMSLAELTILQRTPRYVSASLSYHMFRLSEQLKQSLNVSNSHQIQLVSTSAEMQKEILGAMSSFWSSLASGSHTNEQLTHIADYITEKRESCKRFYSKTLLMPNEAILINYARFLRDVMLDEESAKMLRERVAEEAEMQRQQKRNQREGHNDISSSINNASRLGSNWEACRLVLRSSEKRQKQNSDDYQLLSQGADAIQRLRMLLYIIFLAIFLLVVALIIFMAVQMSITSTMVNRINAASQTRLYTAVGCVITKEVRNLGALGLSPAQQAPVVASLYGTLRSSATKLYSSHQDLMLGNLLSKSSTVADFVNQKRAELLTPGVQSLEGNYSRSLTSYFDLGFTVASEMMLAGTNEEGSDLARELLAINGDDGSFSRAMNQSVQVYVANQQNYVSNVVWVVIVIYAVSVFLLLAVYAIILVFLRRIEVSKMTTINLFFHIPRSYLEVLYRTSRDKTRYFERDEDLLEDDVGGAANNNNNGGIKSPPPSKSRRPAPESPTSAGTSTGSAAIFSGAEERAPGRDGEAARHAGSDDDDDDEETSTSANSPRQSGAASPMHAEDGKDRNMIVHEPVADSGNTIAADEVEQHSITAILGGISKSLSGTTIVMLVMVVACLFAVAAFVLAYRFHIISINLDTSTDNLMGFINRATRYFDYLTTLGTYAQQYTITGDVVHVERYHDYLAVNDYTELFQTGIAEASNAAVVSCVVNLRVLLNSAMDRQVVAMWLASSYYGMTPDDTYIFSRVNAVNHDYDYTAMASVEQTAFAPFNPVVPSPTASTNVIDGSLPVADQLQIARNLVFSDYYQDLRFLVANNLAQMVDVHDSNRDHLINEQKGVWIACIVMLGCCMLALFFSLHGFLRQRRSSLIVQVLCATCVLVAIATIIILSVAYKNAVDGNNYHDYYFTYLQCFNDTSLNLAANRFYALRMQRYGYTSTEAIWAPTAAVSTYNASLNQLEVALATSTPDPEVAKETLQVLQLARDIATLIYYSNIAADLSVNAWGLPDTPVLVGFYYNRQFELNYMMGYFMLGSNVDDYSYPVYDFALPTATQLAIAQRAISGPRYDVVSKSFSEGFSTTMQSIGNSMLGRADNSEDNVSKFGLASMIMSACLMGGIILLTMFAIYHVMMVKAAMNSPDEDSLVESADDITGPNLDMATKGNLVSLVLFLSIFSVLVLLSAILFMGLFYKSRQIQNTNLLSSIKERDWSFIEAVMDAQQVWYNSPNMSDMSPYLVDLLRSIITTLQFREDLYLGDGNTYEGLLSISQSQNRELFGSDVYAYEEYHAPCRTFIYDPGYAVLDFKNFMDGQDDDMLANLYSGGVENVVWQLLGLLINVLNQKQVETSLPYDTALFAIFPSVSRKLVNSSNSYFDDRSHNGTLIATVFIILCSVTLVLIVLLVLFVFRPLLQHLQEEEEGTRLLLRMIPENIRREVPAIHDFFQTGNVNHDAEIILEACAEVEQSAMVVLTDQDVVTRITQDALHRFQRTADEVIGKHVEVLLSEERGRVMADYRRRNGRSRLALLVGKKGNSYGRTSEGVVFPIEINVREVTLYGNSTTTNKSKCFVVVFRPVTIKQDKSVVRQIQAAIISDSDHAQLVIDARGILRSVNRSTKRMFSYKQDELLGRHLSALIAPTDDHDSDAYVQNLLNQLSYLAREDRSAQVKHRLNGITQDERVFPAEMAFATVVNDAGEVQYILIHVRDLTDDASSTKGDAMSNALIDISPIPVVVLDEDSNIVFFNKAAERSWGLTSGRVMGSTLNDLLYGADATRYDFSRHSQSDLRHFLDVSRTLDAKRSTGEQFLTEVTMRELRRGDNTLSVIAFFKDLSKEVEVSQRNALSECAFQGCPIPVVVMDERGRVEKINKAAERQFGYAAKELEGQSVNLIMPDHIAQKHDSYLERYLTTGVKKMLAGPRSVYAKRADGRLFSVEARVLEVMVDDALAGGKAQRMFIGFLRDTTEHYQMMKANELHEAVTDHCPVAMLSCNHAGRLLSLNGAAQKLFECGPTSMIGQPMEKVLPNFEEVFRFPAKKGQAPGSMDGVRPLQARTISGNLSAVEVRIREIRKGTVDALFVASVSPISVKTKLEDESNMERAFISLYPRAIIVVNTRGTLRYASDQAVQLFGYVKSTDMAGNHLTTIIPCEDAKQQDKFISSLIKNNNNNNNNTSSSAANYTCLRKDGLTFTARIHSKRLSTDDLPTSARGLSGVASSMDSEELHVLFIHDQTYQHTLMRSDQIREAMLTTMDFGAVQINASGIIVYANNYFATIFRYGSAMEVIGKSINLIMPRNVAKEHDRYLQNYLKTGQSRVMGTSRELTGVRRDGSSIHVEVTIRDLLDPTHGRTIFGFLRDISEVFEIRNHHRLLKQLVSTSPMPALLVSYHHDVDEGVVATNTNTKTSSAMGVGAYTSSEGIIYSTNEAALTHFCYTEAELIGMSLEELRKADAGDLSPRHNLNASSTNNNNSSSSPNNNKTARSLVEMYHDAKSDQVPSFTSPTESRNPAAAAELLFPTVSTTMVALKKGGKTFPVRIIMMEMYDEDINGFALLIYVEELTHKMQEQFEQRISATVAEICPTALIGADQSGDILLFSEQAESIFGYMEKEVLGRHMSLLMTPKMAKDHARFMETYLNGPDHHLERRASTKLRQVARHKNGSLVPIEIELYESAPVLAVGGNARATAAMQRTNLAQQQQQQQQQPRVGAESALSDKRRLFIAKIRLASKDCPDAVTGALSQLTMSAIGIPFVMFSGVGVIEHANAALANLFGYAADELLSRNIKILISPHVAKKFDDYTRHLVRTAQVMDGGATAPLSNTSEDGANPTPATATSAANNTLQPPLYITAKHKTGRELRIEISVGLHCAVPSSVNRTTLYAFVRSVENSLELRREQAIHEALTDLESIAVLLINSRGIITHASARARTLFGYLGTDANAARNESNLLEGQDLRHVVPKAKDFRKFCASFEDDHGKMVELHLTGVRRDGGTIPCAARLKEVSEGGDEVTYVCLISSTARDQRTEDYTTMVGSLNKLGLLGVVVMNARSMITHVNERMLRTLHYDSASELLGKKIESIMLAKDAEVHHKYMESYLRGLKGTPFIINQTRRVVGSTREGQPILLDLSVEEHFIGPTREHIFVSYFEDLTETAKKETNEQTASLMLAMIPVASVLVDAQGVVLYASESCRSLFAVKDDLVGRSLRKYLLPQSVEVLMDGSGHLHTGELELSFVTAARTSNNEPRLLHTSTSITALAGTSISATRYLCFITPKEE